VRIELHDEVHASALVRFFRERECIAYVAGDPKTVEVIRPHAFGPQEADEIRSRLGSWRLQHPEVEFRVLDEL
jgi:hypothetical protein